MHYFALLISQEVELAPEQRAEGMAAFQAFHAKAKSAIRAGDALDRAGTAARIDGGPDNPTVTDGPYAEGAEVANGFYVLRASDREEAVKLASMIPASAIEVRQLSDVSGL